MPDTLDIAERAKLAINGLTGPTDPEADYELYWLVYFWSNPPIMKHQWADFVQRKFEDSLPLLRIVTGSDLNQHVDRAWMESFLHSIGPDGLYYSTQVGRLWGFDGLIPDAKSPIWKANGEKSELPPDEAVKYLSGWTGPCDMISPLIAYYLRDGNPMWRETIERMIEP